MTATLDWSALTDWTATTLPRLLCHQHPALAWPDAQDAAAEALARLWARHDTFDATRTTGRRWLLLTAERLLIDAHRRRGGRVLLPLDDALAKPDTIAWTDAAEARVECQAVLAGLTPWQAQAVWWHHGLGLSVGEGAAALGIGYRAFCGRVNAGRAAARRLVLSAADAQEAP